MDLDLHGKTALVLGGGGGLGSAIATTLAGEGVNVAVADIDEAALERSVQDIRQAGASGLALTWNLADLSSIDRHVTAIEHQFGSVDILVNITGGPPPTAASGQDPALWISNFQSMVLSVIAISDRVLPGMRAKKHGRIITSTSSGSLATQASSVDAIGSSTKPSVPVSTARVPAGSPAASEPGCTAGADVPSV